MEKYSTSNYNPLSLTTRAGILALVILMLCKCTYQEVYYDRQKEMSREVTSLSLFDTPEREPAKREYQK